MSEKISFPKQINNKQEEIKNEISFPHGESILRLFKDKYKNDEQKYEIVKTILYDFFEQELDNIEIFESEKFEASFPWTVFKTKDLFRKIFEKYSNQDELEREVDCLIEDETIISQEFIFSSGSMVQSGYPFTFVEEAMHQALISLKSDLMALKEGEKIKGREIYTVGLPTNELGKVGSSFLEKMKNDPFDTLSDLQTEFVQNNITRNEKGGKLNIKLYGISTGASLAAATGEKLIAKGIATQDIENKEQDVPRLSLRMDSPVGLSDSARKNWQIPAGYAAEFIYQTFKDPKFRLTDPKFMKEVKETLSKRGITENMSEEDESLKKESIKLMINKLIEGVDFDKKLKVTKVSGLLDPLTFSLMEYINEKKRQSKTTKSLGKNIAPRTDKNRREFMIDQTHTPAFFRESEIKGYYKVAELIQDLKNKKHSF